MRRILGIVVNRLAWCVLIGMIAFIGGASSETVSVTSFGRGETKREAIEAAQLQALQDASRTPVERALPRSLRSLSKSSPHVRHSKIISVQKIGPSLYEAQVEVLVSLGDPLEQQLRVAVIAYPNQNGNAMTSELVEDVRRRLSRSPQIVIVDNTDPAVTVALERFNSRRWHEGPSSTDLGGTFELDFLYVVSSGSLQRTEGASGVDHFELNVKVDMVNVGNGGERIVTTVKSTLSGAPDMVDRAIALEAGKQVSIQLAEKLGTAAADASRSRVIEIPATGMTLSKGQQVEIYRKVQSREILATTGAVVEVQNSILKIATRRILSKSQIYIAKPAKTQNQNGIILDSDW
jgi:hypothetical protein